MRFFSTLYLACACVPCDQGTLLGSETRGSFMDWGDSSMVVLQRELGGVHGKGFLRMVYCKIIHVHSRKFEKY